MIDFAAILKQTSVGVLATREGDGVRTRVFQFLFADGKKVYFCTSSQKPVYSQLQTNPNVSFCTYTADFSPVLSLNGKVVFVDDMVQKKRALDENPSIKGIYNTPDNPVFKVFYIAVEEIETFSFAEGPQSYKV